MNDTELKNYYRAEIRSGADMAYIGDGDLVNIRLDENSNILRSSENGWIPLDVNEILNLANEA